MGVRPEDIDPASHALRVDFASELDLVDNVVVRELAVFILEHGAFLELNLLHGILGLEDDGSVSFTDEVV